MHAAISHTVLCREKKASARLDTDSLIDIVVPSLDYLKR